MLSRILQMTPTSWRMSSSPFAGPARLLLAAGVLVVAAGACGGASAQELVLPAQPAPPPMRYLPDDVRSQLSTASSPKERVVTTLAVLEQLLTRAEQSTHAQRFDPAAADLGVYQAVLDDVLEYLKPVGRSAEGKVDGKTRDLYKRLELTLNKHTARIESIRRVTPALYAGNVRAAFNYARDRRTEALEAFFVETVVKLPRESGSAQPDQPKNDAPKKSADKPPAP